ncbi:hypothetical protein Tco_0044841 [Tanacetum coccineum]
MMVRNPLNSQTLLFNMPRIYVTAKTQTPTITSSPPKIHSVHKPNDVALPIGLSDMALRPRGRPRKIETATHSTHTPIIAKTTSLLATPKHTNVFASASEVSSITPGTVGRPRKFQHTTNSTHTPPIATPPLLLATPQHSNVVASSSGVSNISPRSVGRPRKFQKTTRTHNTNTYGSTSGTHRQKGKSVRMKSSHRINFNDTDDEDEAELTEYRDHEDPIFGCESCGALLWHSESIVGNTHANSESYSLYCGRGKVMLPKKLKNPPKQLMDLINKKHQKSTTFIDNIRRYNSMFAFTSIGGKQDKSVNTGRGPYCYMIQGMNYHRMGALLSDEGKPPIFSHLYIYDTENEIENKIKFASNGESTSSGKKKIDHQLTTKIRDMLDTNNPLVTEFRMAGERFVSKKNQNNVRLRLIGTRERDGRKYNLPTASEVAALIVGDFHSTEHKRDIILEEQGGDLQ